MDDGEACLSPLEQRRARLRALADRVLEAIEKLPMPETALEGERSMRAIAVSDRMLIQLYGTPSPQTTISHAPRPVAYGASSRASPGLPGQASGRAAVAPRPPEPAFAADVSDDGDDDMPEDVMPDEVMPDDGPEPLSPTARAYLDLEQRANDIFQHYLNSRNDGENADADSAADRPAPHPDHDPP